MKKTILLLIMAFAMFCAKSQINNVAVVGISSNGVLETEGFTDVAITAMADLFIG